MKAAAESVEVLLLQAGEWQVGVDPRAVARVEPVGDANVPPVTLSDLLRPGEGGTTPVRRVLLVREGKRLQRLGVERTLGTRALALRTMRDVPPLLRAYGAPSWWLGLSWQEDAAVLVLDLAAAVRGLPADDAA